MKAWKVYTDACGYIVFSTSGNMAKSMAHTLPGFECDEWTDIRVARLPELDGKRDYDCVLDWEKDGRIYYEAGWWPVDGTPSCDCCGRYQYDEFPESRVTDTEDGYMCVACMASTKEAT